MPRKIDPLNKKLYGSVTTMLTVTDVKAAAFYQKAFGFAKRGRGDRCGTVVDPEGYAWMVATHIAQPTPQEMKKRMKDQTSSQPGTSQESGVSCRGHGSLMKEVQRNRLKPKRAMGIEAIYSRTISRRMDCGAPVHSCRGRCGKAKRCDAYGHQ